MVIRMATVLCVALVCLLMPSSALAYVGPGSGIAAIASALAFLGGIVLLLIGFVWYPVKRLWRRLSGITRVQTPAR